MSDALRSKEILMELRLFDNRRHGFHNQNFLIECWMK